MTWETFYLVCFVVGFALSLISFLSGAFHLHLPMKWHMPGWLSHHTFARGNVHAAHGYSPFNASTLMAFLAWFGGMGYLLSRYSALRILLVFGVALGAGLAGAGIIFWFLVKVLLSRERELEPGGSDVVGLVATVSVPIREGGLGEVIYSQAGTRHGAGARSESGEAIPRGCEVVITRYEEGIASVRPWEEFVNSSERKSGHNGAVLAS